MTVQRSGGSEGEGRSVTFQYFAEPELILSHRGARPLILTDVDLIPSDSGDACTPSDQISQKFFDFETVILEPGEVRTLLLEFAVARGWFGM